MCIACCGWTKHDDAYAWAARRRVAIHPELGTVQVFESVHAEEPSAAATARRACRGSLFAKLKDRELVRLGVPEESIERVRAVTDEAQLDALETSLPDEAYEALFLYAADEPYENLIREREKPETVDTTDFATALDRDASKRHFLVLTEDSDLEALLAAPLALWRVFLHPSQRKLIERDWNGPVRVLGGAGTGKTVVAMHRAVWLARKYADLPGKPRAVHDVHADAGGRHRVADCDDCDAGRTGPDRGRQRRSMGPRVAATVRLQAGAAVR